MEGIFANLNFERSDELIVGIAAGRLSLSEGEGEGEGSPPTRSQRSRLNHSPQFSPLLKGERRSDRKTACLPRTTNIRASLCSNENRRDC
jgi:hypothetical protein